MDCLLCILEKKTKIYYENKLYTILDCATCNVPMYVWKSHEFPTVKQRIEMYSDANKRFPDRKLDLVRRQIPEHFHFHMR